MSWALKNRDTGILTGRGFVPVHWNPRMAFKTRGAAKAARTRIERRYGWPEGHVADIVEVEA